MDSTQSVTGAETSAPRRTVVIIASPDSGKNAILIRALMTRKIKAVSTIGLDFETPETLRRVSMVLQSLSGRGLPSFLPMLSSWSPPNFADCDGLIFVVDGSDGESLQAASRELTNALNNNALRGAPLLLLVNKTDLQSFIGLSAVVNALEMDKVVNRLWHVHACSAETEEGIMEALEELAKMMKNLRRY